MVQITEANSVEEIIGLLKTQPTGQVDYFVQLADNTMVPVFEDHIIFNYPDIDKLVIEEKGKPLKEKGGGKGGLSINTTVSKGEEPPGSPSMRLLMKGIKTVRTSLSIKRTGSFSLSAGSEKPSKPKGPSESPPSSAPAVPAPHIPVHGMTTAMKAARVRSSSKVRSRFESLQGHSHESSNRASFIGSAEDPDVTGSTSTLSLSAELESMRDLQIQNTQLQSARSGGHGFDFSFQGIEKIEIGNDLFTPQSGTLPEEFGSNVTPYDIINKERENVFNKFREQFHVGMPWKAPPQLKDMVTPVFEDIPAQGNVYVRYHLGQSNSVVIQVISAITCEKLLQHLCTRHLIDYAAHTFEVKIGQEPQQPAEMNRFVGAICQSQLITDFYIVKKAKQYKTTAIEEFGEPVMNCTTIAGK